MWAQSVRKFETTRWIAAQKKQKRKKIKQNKQLQQQQQQQQPW